MILSAILVGSNPFVAAVIAVVIALVCLWLLTLVPADVEGGATVKKIGRFAIIAFLVLYLLNLVVGFV